MTTKLIRLPALLDRTGYSRALAYRRIQAGLLPPPVHITTRAVAWPESEIEAINRARIAGRTDDDIRIIVRELVAARAAAAPRVTP